MTPPPALLALPLLLLLLLLLLLYRHPTPTPIPTPIRSPTPTPTLHTPPTIPRGILMSCPPGSADTNKGPWKPSRMTSGIEAILRQQLRHNTTLPLLLAYYPHERAAFLPYCRSLRAKHPLHIRCFPVPEPFPAGRYGYPKIFALAHAPVQQALWLDCDVFPLRKLDDLFEDDEFRRTGALFWPDSRDFFDETAVMRILPRTAKNVFTPEKWYVRQGFDSGLLLLDLDESRAEIDEIARIARSPHEGALRALSMGDKDIFHVVWMLHGKNFSLVPYIGETGSLQVKGRGGKVGWVMSSQVKYGRDGRALALHQLHRQHGSARIASMDAERFFGETVTRSTTHVKPFLSARVDLRLGAGEDAGFVGAVEKGLLGSAGMARVVRRAGTRVVVEARGLRVEWSPSWIHAAAAEMGRAWRHGVDPGTAAREIFREHRKMLLKRRHGGYRKPIYRRLWKDGRQGERRRSVRRFRRIEDEDRAIRARVGGSA